MKQVHTTSTEREHVLSADCWCQPEVQQVPGRRGQRVAPGDRPPAVVTEKPARPAALQRGAPDA